MGVEIYVTSGASQTSVRFVPGYWSSRVLSVSHKFARASLLQGLARECTRTRQLWAERTPPGFEFAVKAYSLPGGQQPESRVFFSNGSTMP